MSQPMSLKEAERRAFRAAYDDGLWDVLLGCFFLMFAVAPLLSETLGDFWSSVVFLPFWGLVYLAIYAVRKTVVAPRVGTAKFGRARKARLAKLSAVLLVFNVLALILGIIAALNFNRFPGQAIAFILGLQLLAGFSLAAYFLDFNRLYIYGLLAWLAPVVGEWLFNRGLASHHGYPLMFGLVSGVMIVTGLTVFARLVRANPLPGDEFPAE